MLLVAAHRHRDAMATPRRLFAAALLVGAVSGLTSAAYSVVTGRPSPTGWLADWIYLSYAPLAVAGTLLISRGVTGEKAGCGRWETARWPQVRSGS